MDRKDKYPQGGFAVRHYKQSMGMDHVDEDVTPKGGMKRTAGEVRFIKDRGGDTGEWAWGEYSPKNRNMVKDHKYNKKCAKDLARVLRSTLMALGHAMSAYSVFAKIKSRDVSPDGSLGGKGYIMEIKSMRKQYMNVVEALSALSDTVYDEINEDHWAAAVEKLTAKILKEVEQIKEDPENWAEENETEGESEVGEDKSTGRDLFSKRASFNHHDTMSARIARRYMGV